MFAQLSVRVHWLTLVAAMIAAALTFAITKAAEAQTASAECTIVVGGGGDSETYEVIVSAADPVKEFQSIKAREFIRSTTGNCVFTLFNQEELQGRYPMCQ